MHIFSGHHRFAAAFRRDLTFPLLPLEKVPVTVVKGDFDALVERMWNAHDENNPKKNPAFGLQLSRAQETAQRLIQLSFPHIYRQLSNPLGELWDTSRKTVDRLRQKFKEQLWDIVKLNLPPDALLQRYHYTPERLATMVELVKSGERVGADGKMSSTQASETKKEETREHLIQECRELITEFKACLATFCEKNGITVRMNSRQRITRKRCSSEVNGSIAGMTNRGNSCEFPKKIVFFEKIDCFFEKNVIFA